MNDTTRRFAYHLQVDTVLQIVTWKLKPTFSFPSHRHDRRILLSIIHRNKQRLWLIGWTTNQWMKKNFSNSLLFIILQPTNETLWEDIMRHSSETRKRSKRTKREAINFYFLSPSDHLSTGQYFIIDIIELSPLVFSFSAIVNLRQVAIMIQKQ